MDLSRSVSVGLYDVTELHENQAFGVTFRRSLQTGTHALNDSSKKKLGGEGEGGMKKVKMK
jgi:hypothetical protein